MDKPCVDSLNGSLSARSRKSESGCGDVAIQTRRDSGCNPENPISLSKMNPPYKIEDPLEACVETPPKIVAHRNPITGFGLGEDGVGGVKPKKAKDRRGLPNSQS